MNDMITSSITAPITDTITITSGTMTAGPVYGSIAMGLLTEDIIDKYDFNKVVVDHKVTAAELLKLKEVAPDYANEIKENLAKNAARDIMKKMTFTKKHDIDSDVHHFIGRVWVFTEEELKKFIEDVKNA